MYWREMERKEKETVFANDKAALHSWSFPIYLKVSGCIPLFPLAFHLFFSTACCSSNYLFSAHAMFPISFCTNNPGERNRISACDCVNSARWSDRLCSGSHLSVSPTTHTHTHMRFSGECCIHIESTRLWPKVHIESVGDINVHAYVKRRSVNAIYPALPAR